MCVQKESHDGTGKSYRIKEFELPFIIPFGSQHLNEYVRYTMKKSQRKMKGEISTLDKKEKFNGKINTLQLSLFTKP